jgi:hypothetical protein
MLRAGEYADDGLAAIFAYSSSSSRKGAKKTGTI